VLSGEVERVNLKNDRSGGARRRVEIGAESV